MNNLKIRHKPGEHPQRACQSNLPAAILFIRWMLGFVFLSEGIQKFLFPAQLGVGRFLKIGIPQPGVLAPLIGGLEIVGGLLLITGLWTRLICLPLLGVMLVAVGTTKLGIFEAEGFWRMAHEGRTDFCMLMGLCFIALVGAGPGSLDWLILKRGYPERQEAADPKTIQP